MRTCVHHGEEYLLGHGRYRCTSPEITIRTSCDQPSDMEHPPCFVPLPAAAPEPAPLMSCGHPRSDLRGHDEATSYCAGCERESREPDPVPDSTPVTFADVLRYHRRLAQDPRADRAWHEEAVLVLFLLSHELYRACGEETCIAMPYDGPRCHRDLCPVWQARKAVEVET